MKRKKDGYSDSELPVLLQSMASLSFVVVICVGAFFGIGYLLDKYLGTGATGMVVATFAGAGVAIFWAYKRVSVLLFRIYRNDASDADSQEDESNEAESKRAKEEDSR